ncbi:MAG: hypothetical protein WA811_12540, partial [Candidatus Sulfotelmatobacter sp.]
VDLEGGQPLLGAGRVLSRAGWTAEWAVPTRTRQAFVALSTFILSFSTIVAVETSNPVGAERFPTQ